MASLLSRIFKRKSVPEKQDVAPPRQETIAFPGMYGFGASAGVNQTRAIYKPVPRNLRRFSRTPIARAAINTIRNPIEGLEWEITPVEGVNSNSEIKRQCEVVRAILASPNTDLNFQRFIGQIIEDYCLGAAAIEMQDWQENPDRPIIMFPVDGLSIQIYPGWNGSAGEPRYAQKPLGSNSVSTGTQIDLLNDELIYIAPNSSTDTPFGHGPLEIAFETISRALGVAAYAGKVAANSLPNFGINLAGADTETLLAFRAYWENEVEGNGRIPIYSGVDRSTADGKPMGSLVERLYPADDKGLYLQYQEFLKREISCAFGISAQNLSVEADVNRNTAEVAEDRDWDMAIRPAARLIASHFNRELILGKLGFSQIEFRWKALEREDELAAVQIDKMLFDMNSITPNQIMQKRGMELSSSQWANMYKVDMEIAQNAARSAGVVEDDNLKPQQPVAQPSTKPASKAPIKAPENKEN